jgi:hypothetical protein
LPSELITLKESEIDWQHWVIENMGDLIAAAPNLSPPPKEKIHETLSAYVKGIANDNMATFNTLAKDALKPILGVQGKIYPK